MRSSREVGGDYFDFFSFDADSVGRAIAGVSGKGIPAAMALIPLHAFFKHPVEL